MLIDETKYIWKRGGDMEVSVAESPHTIYFPNPLKVYLLEGTAEVSIYTNEEMTDVLFEGSLPFEPIKPIACDALFFVIKSESAKLHITAEVGTEKTALLPFLNTAEEMESLSNSYNDDGTFSTEGLDGFIFNGIAANPLYIASNHWIGFGTSTEQLRILRRDGCSTAIYRQLGETTNGLRFLKIRFEGYTVYNNRVDATRLIFELFLLSSNDMFLNVIQTPTSVGYLGTSELISGGITTALALADGSGGGIQVSFYHQNEGGRTWNIVYAMYEETDTYSFAYLLRQADIFYTYGDGALEEVPINTLTAAMFLKYGFEEIPPAEILTSIDDPQMYLWKSGGTEELLKANVKAYPYPQVLEAVADMDHISILGIKMMTAEYSGDVMVSISVDNDQTYSENMPLGDWLNTDVEELWGSLSVEKKLLLRFTLHANAAISRFKITYIN